MTRSITTAELADWASHLRFEDLPLPAIEQSRTSIVDTVGVAIAGSTTRTGELVRQYVDAAAGAPGGPTVLGSGTARDLDSAVFANGVLAHTLDFDDTWAPPTNQHQGTASHPSCTIVPAILGLAQHLRSSGEEVLTAYVAGMEVHGKVGFPGRTTARTPYHGTAIFGALGAAAASASLLRLDAHQTQQALGLAAGHASGLNVHRGTMTKAYQAGNAAMAGVRAARLVAMGFAAADDGLEGAHGFADAFLDPEHWPARSQPRTIGQPLSVMDPGVILKKYAACFFTHRALDGLSQVIQHHGPVANRVRTIETRVGPGSIVDRPRPRTGLEAKFSLQYSLAQVALGRQLRPGDFSDELVMDPAVTAMMGRVNVVTDPSIASHYERATVPVAVTLDDGTMIAEALEGDAGGWSVPLSHDMLVKKFQDCARDVFTDEEVRRLLQGLLALDAGTDVAALMSDLAGFEPAA